MKSGRANKAPSQRQLRVGEELRHVLSGILARGELRDPDLAEVSVTVGEVRMSHDLRNATAFVLPLGGEDGEVVLTALRRAAPFIRGQVARAMRLRFAPTISFQYDTSFDYAQHIASLLEGAAKPRPEADDAEDGSDGPDAPGTGRDDGV